MFDENHKYHHTGCVIKALISVVPSSSISSAHSFSCSSLIWRAKLLKTFSSSFVDTRPSPFLSKRLNVLCASAKHWLVWYRTYNNDNIYKLRNHVLHKIHIANINGIVSKIKVKYPKTYQKIYHTKKMDFFLFKTYLINNILYHIHN